MALHSKAEKLLELKPDIAIIPECAEPDVIRAKSPDFTFSDCEWTGDNRAKGLGIFSFGRHTLRRHQSWDRKHQIFIPIEVRGPIAANLLAVWAFNHRATVSPNPATTNEAIETYSSFLKSAPAIVAGDFNANVRWDGSGGGSRFSETDQALRMLGLRSVYHERHGVTLGREAEHPTFFLQRNAEKTYHIDYAYLPDAWMPSVKGVTIGTADAWIAHSDHAPLVVDLELPTSAEGGRQ